MRNKTAIRSLAGGFLCCLCAMAGSQHISRAQDKKDPPEEPKKLNEVIEKSINWYDVLPEEGATAALTPTTVIRWRNVTRGQEGEA